MVIDFSVNGSKVSFDGDAEMPLLWFLRDHAKLTGTKYGCGVGACGACTVHVDNEASRSCLLTLQDIAGRSVTTIEGLAAHGRLHPLQVAWIEEDVVQCGYCQAGQLMAAADLLRRRPQATEEDIASLDNICRCGTYPRIRKAIRRAARILRQGQGS